MKVSTEQATATVLRIARITEDHPVVKPDSYRRAFRVDYIGITYTWKDGRFDVINLFDIRLGGHWVKQDGTDAKDRASGMRPDRVSYTSDEFTPQYAWLQPIINLLRPTPEMGMTILNEAEVGQ